MEVIKDNSTLILPEGMTRAGLRQYLKKNDIPFMRTKYKRSTEERKVIHEKIRKATLYQKAIKGELTLVRTRIKEQ